VYTMKDMKMKGKLEGKMSGGSHAIDSTVHTVVGDVAHNKTGHATPESIIGKIVKKK